MYVPLTASGISVTDDTTAPCTLPYLSSVLPRRDVTPGQNYYHQPKYKVTCNFRIALSFSIFCVAECSKPRESSYSTDRPICSSSATCNLASRPGTLSPRFADLAPKVRLPLSLVMWRSTGDARSWLRFSSIPVSVITT